jgi:xanthine dehydrogenase accessory factor
MRETRDLLAAIDAAEAAGEEIALATVVHIEGSTYRRPGARMLVPASGTRIGTVSGGCLEDDVSRMTREVMAENHARMTTFDLTAEDDALWGYGLGCNGLIELFLEPSESVLELRDILREVLDGRRQGTLITVLDSSADGVSTGDRAFVTDGQPRVDELGPVAQEAADLAARARAGRRTLTRQVDSTRGRVRLFAEPLDPPVQLLVCGAGDDAVPLARYADDLGWSVTVTDPRRPLLSEERFPSAVRLPGSPDKAMAQLELTPRSAVVVMSHNFLRDAEYLRRLLGSPAFYGGMLGPRQRTDRLFDFLADEGVRPSSDDLDRLHAPAGLDIGAEGPQQIAWAILTEILAVLNGRPGAPLRFRAAPIHEDAEPVDHPTATLAGSGGD